MPLPIANLDDRTFDQLAGEAQSLIPKTFPAWTDFNPSEPGITLLELFAFLVEAAIYQVNRVPERSLERFAELAGVPREPGEAIEQMLRRAGEALRLKYRAITEGEFEKLALQAAPNAVARAKALVQALPVPGTAISLTVQSQSVSGTIISVAPFDSGPWGLVADATVKTVDGSRLTHLAQGVLARQKGLRQIAVQDPSFAASLNLGDVLLVALEPNVFPLDEFVEVMVVPNDTENPAPSPTDPLRQQVFQFLRPRRLITTRIKAVPPDYTRVSVGATVVRDPGSGLAGITVQQKVAEAIRNYLSPFVGGADGTGWGFGRSVFRSELYQRIQGVEGVDHVRQLLLDGSDTAGEIPLLSATSLVDLKELTVAVLEP